MEGRQEESPQGSGARGTTPLWPKQSHQSEESNPVGTELVEHGAKQSELRERIILELIPRLEKGIYPRCPGNGQGGEIHWETIVKGGEKKEVNQLVDYHLSQGPL